MPITLCTSVVLWLAAKPLNSPRVIFQTHKSTYLINGVFVSLTYFMKKGASRRIMPLFWCYLHKSRNQSNKISGTRSHRKRGEKSNDSRNHRVQPFVFKVLSHHVCTLIKAGWSLYRLPEPWTLHCCKPCWSVLRHLHCDEPIQLPVHC